MSKLCSKCGTVAADDVVFCANCGERFPMPNEYQPSDNYQQTNNTYSANYQHSTPFYDHTAEFDPKDVSENKVIAMLLYLMGFIGIIMALLMGNTSPYVAFHLRQALKFIVAETLLGICIILLCWTFIVPIAGLILYLAFGIIKIICFFQICSGKAVEPAIIRSLGCLR